MVVRGAGATSGCRTDPRGGAAGAACTVVVGVGGGVGVALGMLVARVVVVVVAVGGAVVETAVGVGDWHPAASANANRTTGTSRI